LIRFPSKSVTVVNPNPLARINVAPIPTSSFAVVVIPVTKRFSISEFKTFSLVIEAMPIVETPTTS
jgi:hypothetical protein